MKRLNFAILLLCVLAGIPFQYAIADNPTPCEFLLRRGERSDSRMHDMLGETRMTDAETRERVLREMGGPSPSERDEIFKSAPHSPKGPPATPLARAAIQYLAKHPEWTPYQRAVLWEIFAVDLFHFPDFIFRSDFHKGTDGSYLFVGAGGEAIVFSPNGKMYRGSQIFISAGKEWKADYEDFFEIDGSPREPRPFVLK